MFAFGKRIGFRSVSALALTFLVGNSDNATIGFVTFIRATAHRSSCRPDHCSAPAWK
jgi:hypothetical protein